MGGVTTLEQTTVQRGNGRWVRSDCDLETKLATFDFQRWSVACREMQIRILNGHVDAAKDVVDAFARFEHYVTATINSPVSAVLPVRVANALEAAGYMTLAAVDRATDHTLVSTVRNLGASYIDVIRTAIANAKAGHLLEQYEEDADLLDETCFISRLNDHIPLEQTHVMSSGTTAPKPLDQVAALEAVMANPSAVLAELNKQLDAALVEVDRIKERIAVVRRLAGVKVNRTPTGKSKHADNPELEKAIIADVRNHGPSAPSTIGSRIGSYKTAVDICVAASSKLVNIEGKVQLG